MSSTFADDDERIDQLLQEFLARRKAGEQIDVAAFAAQYEPYREELTALLPVFLEMERCASSLDPSQLADEAPKSLGKYRLIRLIGRGGMGLVFEAHHEPLDRRVALKLLSPWRAEAPQARARFLNEARAIAGLQHENLIPIFDVGCVGGYDYFAMQLVDGINGHDFVHWMRGRADQGNRATSKPASSFPGSTVGDIEQWHMDLDFETSPLLTPHTPEHWYFAARMCMQAARALHHAHNAGVVHRDVKSSNVLLDRNGKAWVSDFGLAKKPNSELTRTGIAMGTLRYMAPEQFRGEAVDGRSDIYGLGVTLFEVLTLEDSAVPSTTQLVAKDGPPFVNEQQLQCVPAPLKDVVLRAAMPCADRRYQNALELAQDLENYVNDQPIRASGPTRRERIRWHLLNYRTAWSMTLLGMLLVLTLIVGGYVIDSQQRDVVTVNGHELYIHGRDREIATWVLERGGIVRVFDGYQEPRIYHVDDLPNRVFNVSTISFWDFDGLDHEMFKRVVRLKGLNELLLDNCRFDEDCVELLPELALISLQLNECAIADKSLPHIAKLDRLVWLGLRDNDLSDDGVALLKPLHNLSEVNLSGNTRLTNRCLRPFAGKNAMVLLDVRGTQIDAQAAEAYQAAMQKYDLSCKVLYGDLPETVTMHGNKLYLNSDDREVAESVLRRGGKVTVLDKKVRTEVQNAEELPLGIFNICSISFIDNQDLTAEDIRRFVQLPRLNELRLQNCKLEEEWLFSLRDAPLISLELENCGLTDGAARHISQIKHLMRLKLPSNRLSDEAVRSLAALEMLTELDLSENSEISDFAFDLLDSTRFTLQRIDARDTRASERAAAKLQSQLRRVDSKVKVLVGPRTAK